MTKKRNVKKLEDYCLDAQAKGSIRIFSFNKETGEITTLIERPNLILYSGADILANVVSGNPAYAINVMYIEYENTAGTPTPPAYDRTGGFAYYNGLVTPKDIIRVPLITQPDISSSDVALYDGNQPTFFSVSEGSVGAVAGINFNSASNSKVYGAALVAAPDINDRAQDKVFSRVYFNDPIAKQTGHEIGVTWVIRFK
jgi:hypothetical protein